MVSFFNIHARTHAHTHTRVRQWVDEDSEIKFMEKRLKLN